MEIISGPEYPEKNIATCVECSCQFRYFDTEIERTNEEVFGNWVLSKSLKCPGCGNSILLDCHTIFDSDDNTLSKNLKNFLMHRKNGERNVNTVVLCG